jgi:predicted nucleic acid-binding protein
MKISIESSILVEYLKGNQTDLLEQLISSGHELYTNVIVYSEFIFYYLATIGEKSPLTIKENKQIKELIQKYEPIDIFSYFTILPIENEIILLSYDYMQKYNLLPNDALILATTKLNEIEYLVSFDKKDFQQPCNDESITLIMSVADLK